ncbi:MAG: LytTR family DNA-binding domain-containing protein [Cyclobacteriaceae bacterium]
MNTLIIEDESLAAQKLIGLIEEIKPEIQVVDQLKSIESSVEWLSNNSQPDLIFCDIELLDGQCFEIFKNVKVKCPVIFTTAYDQYAIKAFEVNSIDYLLKPIKPEKLKASLHKLDSLRPGSTEIDLNQLADLIKAKDATYKSRFMVKVGQKIRSVSVDEIAYFFTREKLTMMVTTTGDKYVVDQPLDELELLLNPEVFFRANRRYLTRIESISEIHPYFKGRVKINLNPSIDDDIVISSEKTPTFKAWLDK